MKSDSRVMQDDNKGEKPEKTPEELAEIAYLDRLRACEGEEMPVGLPLACVVKLVGYEEVPKASGTVRDGDGRGTRRASATPPPKKKAVFQPKPAKDDFLAKLRLHRKRYGW